MLPIHLAFAASPLTHTETVRSHLSIWAQAFKECFQHNISLSWFWVLRLAEKLGSAN